MTAKKKATAGDKPTTATTPPNAIEWENVEQLAKRLHCDEMGIYRRIKFDGMPHHRVPGARRYLFDPAEIDRWIREADIRNRCSDTKAGDEIAV